MGFFSGIFDTVKDVIGDVTDVLNPVSSLLSPGLNFLGQQKTNSANAAQTQAQMDFQERMRATQYQTAVKDMEAAGLNPMLAYSQGGAGTPSGAAAVMQNPVSSALEAQRAQADLALIREQAAKTKTDRITSESQQDLNNALQLKASREAELSAASAERVRQQTATERGDPRNWLGHGVKTMDDAGAFKLKH